MSYVCKDFGRPGCCSIPDTRYTMRFDDIGEPPIYFCTHCGPEAAAMSAAILGAFETRPGFVEQFGQAIKDAINDQALETKDHDIETASESYFEVDPSS